MTRFVTDDDEKMDCDTCQSWSIAAIRESWELTEGSFEC